MQPFEIYWLSSSWHRTLKCEGRRRRRRRRRRKGFL